MRLLTCGRLILTTFSRTWIAFVLWFQLTVAGDDDDAAAAWYQDPQLWMVFVIVVSVTALPGLLFVALALTDILLESIRWRADRYVVTARRDPDDEMNEKVSQADWTSDWSTSHQAWRLALNITAWAWYVLGVLTILAQIHVKDIWSAALLGFSYLCFMVATKSYHVMLTTEELGDMYLWRGNSRRSPDAAAEWVQQLMEAPCEMKWCYKAQELFGTRLMARLIEQKEMPLLGVTDSTILPFPLEAAPDFARIKVEVDPLPADEASEFAWTSMKEELIERHIGKADYGFVVSVATIDKEATHNTIVIPPGHTFTLRRLLLQPWVFRVAYLLSFDALYHCWLPVVSPVLKLRLTKVYEASPAITASQSVP